MLRACVAGVATVQQSELLKPLVGRAVRGCAAAPGFVHAF
jgi:hypothetical protein